MLAGRRGPDGKRLTLAPAGRRGGLVQSDPNGVIPAGDHQRLVAQNKPRSAGRHFERHDAAHLVTLRQITGLQRVITAVERGIVLVAVRVLDLEIQSLFRRLKSVIASSSSSSVS